MAENKSETKDELSKTRDVTDVHCEPQSQQHSIRLQPNLKIKINTGWYK